MPLQMRVWSKNLAEVKIRKEIVFLLNSEYEFREI